MTKNSLKMLRGLAILTLLPTTMAAQCAPDVEMSTDGEVGGGSSAQSDPVGGKTATTALGGAAQTGDKGGAAQTGDKGGAAQTGGKGGAASTAYIKCDPTQCGERPEAPETCTNLPIMCEADANGVCGWQVGKCPEQPTCASRLCGDKPAKIDCEGDFDASLECLGDGSGKCQWKQECPNPAMCLGRCGPEPTERTTCPDGSLKRLVCECEGAAKPVFLCSEVDAQKCAWREDQSCPTVTSCKGANMVIVLASLKPALPKTTYDEDPAAIEALCEEVFRQPIAPSVDVSYFGCIAENRSNGYELLFINTNGGEGQTNPGKAFVLPSGECDAMTTQTAASITLRTPSERLWAQIIKVTGVDLRELAASKK